LLPPSTAAAGPGAPSSSSGAIRRAAAQYDERRRNTTSSGAIRRACIAFSPHCCCIATGARSSAFMILSLLRGRQTAAISAGSRARWTSQTRDQHRTGIRWRSGSQNRLLERQLQEISIRELDRRSTPGLLDWQVPGPWINRNTFILASCFRPLAGEAAQGLVGATRIEPKLRTDPSLHIQCLRHHAKVLLLPLCRSHLQSTAGLAQPFSSSSAELACKTRCSQECRCLEE
jgi:hypothetical protein